MKVVPLALAALLLVTGTAQADNSYEECFRSRTNAERLAHNRGALGVDARIDKIARDHSDQMARDGTIYHNEDLGRDYNAQAGGYEYGGENVGMGESCDAIFTAFQKSPGHEANIIDPDYKFVGVGATYDSASSTLYVTLDFWTPKASAKPKPKPKPSPRQTPRCIMLTIGGDLWTAT